MMGHDDNNQDKLFHYSIDLENRVRSDHPLRRIKELIDFDFIYDEVADKYGKNGNVSIPPPVILKLMLLLVLYNVRSERELMSTLPERLDWLWFLGYDLDTEIPNHSVLSKARRRWGVKPFRSFFERIIIQCGNAGLIYGSKIFVDSCLVNANASLNSVVNMKLIKNKLRKDYDKLSQRLDEKNSVKKNDDSDDDPDSSSPATSSRKGVNQTHLSSTDPDASITRIGGVKPSLRYKIHRSVDNGKGIITATVTTPGDVNEAHKMIDLSEQHQINTGYSPKTIVADSKYGTVDNFLACHKRGLRAHLPDLYRTHKRNDGYYSYKMFIYNAQTDTYTCPERKILKRKTTRINKRSADYAASKTECSECRVREKCTRNKSGRTIKRHFEQEALEKMRKMADSEISRIDIRKRTYFMERTFAEGKRYGIKQARWRGLWKTEIQELMTATIQNIQKLAKYGGSPNGIAVTNMTNWAEINALNYGYYPILTSS